MRFKDLQRLVSQQEHTRKELFQRLQDKPFWMWDKQQHKLEDIKTDGEYCFNHIIGLPQIVVLKLSQCLIWDMMKIADICM